jgi:protein-S-isoprenylcysteine O-methyltransferase Ste14
MLSLLIFNCTMAGTESMKHKPLETVGMAVNGLSIALFFYLASALGAPYAPPAMRYLGWLLFGVGLTLIALSVVTLMANREAGLIDRGVYGVVRHPMYLGAILLFLSWVFLLPHWVVLLISLTNAVIVYWFILQGERSNVAKFGDSYRRYMETVPRVNLFAGLLKILQGK